MELFFYFISLSSLWRHKISRGFESAGGFFFSGGVRFDSIIFLAPLDLSDRIVPLASEEGVAHSGIPE